METKSTDKEVLVKGLSLLDGKGRFFVEFGQDLKDFPLRPEMVRKIGKSYLFEFLKDNN